MLGTLKFNKFWIKTKTAINAPAWPLPKFRFFYLSNHLDIFPTLMSNFLDFLFVRK